jgi:hypothetical protein
LGWETLRASSRLIERLPPADPVSDDVQQSPSSGHVVLVAGSDRFPGVAVWVGCRKIEHLC